MRNVGVVDHAVEPGRHDQVRRFDDACATTAARFGDLVRPTTVRVVSG